MIGGLVARHTLFRRRPTLVDDGRGGQVREFDADAPDVALPGWALDAGNTSEDTQNRDASVILYTARGPYTADVNTNDIIVVFGEEFEIDGGVARQPGPTENSSHTILLLKRWVG